MTLHASEVELQYETEGMSTFYYLFPGTCTDYYCIQDVLAYATQDGGWMATPDTLLVHIGPLKHGQRRLQGQTEGDHNEHFEFTEMHNLINIKQEAQI